MARDDGGAAGTIVVAFVLGAITGAAVALLLAPATGEETRRILSEKAKEGREKATDAARQGREFISRQRETISSAIDRGREAYNQARGSAQKGPAGGGDSL
jgi:gas vesicle protein